MPPANSRRSQRSAFTLRLWHEADLGWRGQIVHVQSGQTLFVQDARRLWEFIRTCAGVPAGDALLGDTTRHPVSQEEYHATHPTA